MNSFLFFRYGNWMLIFYLLFSKRVQILKTEYKYWQYCTPLRQSDCKYFFVLAISNIIWLIQIIVNWIHTFSGSIKGNDRQIWPESLLILIEFTVHGKVSSLHFFHQNINPSLQSALIDIAPYENLLNHTGCMTYYFP